MRYTQETDAPPELAMKFILMKSDETKTDLLGVDNLVNLPILNEAELLNSLKLRFMKDKIFSYVGYTLLIVNPFRDLPDLYNKNMIEKFKKCAKSSTFSLK